MKRFVWHKWLLASLVVGLLFALAGAAQADAADFTVKDGVLTAWSGDDADLVIPGNLGITQIGRSVFSGKKGLLSVSIPSGVTSINDSAFPDAAACRWFLCRIR